MSKFHNDLVDKIMDFEAGVMNGNETIEFFAHLIKTGVAWSLQGSYGRSAASLIEREIISDKGEILIEY